MNLPIRKLLSAFALLGVALSPVRGVEPGEPPADQLAVSPEVTATTPLGRATAEGRRRSVRRSLSPASSPFRTRTDGRQSQFFRFSSPGAQGVRLHFSPFHLPPNTEVWIHPARRHRAGGALGPFTGAGPTNEGAFWSPPVEGSSAIVEFVWSGPMPAELPFQVAEVGHLDSAPERVASTPRPVRGRRGMMRWRGQLTSYEVVDGVAMHGDIMLAPEGQLNDEGSLTAASGGVTKGSLWANGIVPYVIDPGLPNQQRVLDAVAHWNQMLAGYVSIVPRTNQSTYVKFVTGSGCSSYVGYAYMAGQPITLADACSTGNAIHEIGHAVGLYHEQTRSDRNTYVIVQTANIDPSYAYNFDISAAVLLGNYDYNSVMHYGAYAFSINGQKTIVTIPVDVYIGQRDGLSPGDIAGVQILYKGSAAPSNTAPTVKTAASATPSNVTGTSTNLSVLGADDAGEAALTYTWAATGNPPAAPAFSANQTNAAKNTTATFSQAGTYTLQVTIKDAGGLSTTSSVNVTVSQTAQTITVTPVSANVAINATLAFSAVMADQFGRPMATQPTFAWSVSGGGSIGPSGLFTAGSSVGGPFTVTASASGRLGSASVSVTNSAPTIAVAPSVTPSPVLGTTANLSARGADDGGESALTYTWSAIGSPPAPVAFSVNGTNTARDTTVTFSKAGAYALQVTVRDASGLSATSSVNVTVNQTLASVAVSPASVQLSPNGTQAFSAKASDQFGALLAAQPGFSWSVSGGGTVNASGVFTAGASAGGPFAVTATIQNGSISGSASVVIQAAPNAAPTANSFSASTPEDTPLPLSFAGSATDPDGNALSYTVASLPLHGTLTGTGSSRVYTPAANFNGADSFTFYANDGQLNSNVATVSLTVSSVNDVPVAQAQSVTTAEDTPRAITLAATDADGDVLSYAVTPPAHGTLSGSGTIWTYTPAANYSGPDAFTFTANDGTATSAAATVSLTVTAVNDPPAARVTATPTTGAAPLTVSFDGTASSDIDGTIAGYAWNFGDGQTGGNSATASHAYGNPGSFAATLTVTDNGGATASKTVTINVSAPVNSAPVAQAQTVSVAEDTSLSITLSATDPDNNALTYRLLSQPARGTLSGTAPTLTYTPAPNDSGTFTFQFVANDGTADSSAATVTIQVTPVNDRPVATPLWPTIAEDSRPTFTLSGSDVEGDPLTYRLVTAPTRGTVTLTGAQAAYVPNANVNGTDSFQYVVNDGSLDSLPATVTITITPVNDAPIALPQSQTVKEDLTLSLLLSGNDPDFDPLSYAVATPPSHGTLTGTPPRLTYTPAANYSGPDSFSFTVSDGQSTSAPATVSLTVTPVNDAPVAAFSATPLSGPSPLTVALDASASSDVDGTIASYSWSFGDGSATATGRTVSHLYSNSGTFSITLTVTDNQGATATASRSIAVNVPVNQPPVAQDASVATDEDTALKIVLGASDPEGSPLRYTVVTAPQSGVLSGTAPSLVYTPAANFNGSDRFTFKANDGVQDSALATVTITVRPVNDAPVARLSATPTNGSAPLAVTFNASASTDQDGSLVSYAWDFGDGATGSGVTVDHTYVMAQNSAYIARLTVRDDSGATASAQTSIYVGSIAPENSAPIVSAIAHSATDIDSETPGLQIYEGTPVTLSATASDPDGDAVRWVWSVILPNGFEATANTGEGAIAPMLYADPAPGESTDWILRVTDERSEPVVVRLHIDALPKTTVPSLPPLVPDLRGIDGKTFRMTDEVSFAYSGSATGFNWDIAANAGARSVFGAGSAAVQAQAFYPSLAPRFNLRQANLSPGSYTLRVQAVNGTLASNWASARITVVEDAVTAVRVSPNPWRHDRHAGRDVVFSIPGGGTLKVLTLSGHLVRELRTSTSLAAWDLRTEQGDPVASGLYLYLATDAEGHRTRGKLAVIR